MRSPADLGIPLPRTRRDQRHYSCSGGLFVTVNRSLGVGCNAVSAPRASTRRLAASRIRIYAVRALLPTHLSQPYRLVVWTVCRTWRHSHIDVTQDRRNLFALLQAAIGAAVQAGEHRFDRQELSVREREVRQIRAASYQRSDRLGARSLNADRRYTRRTHPSQAGFANRAATAASVTRVVYR